MGYDSPLPGTPSAPYSASSSGSPLWRKNGKLGPPRGVLPIRRYVIKEQVRGATSSNGSPEDQLSPKHDLEGPPVVFGRRSCPRDQGVAWGKASQPGKLTLD
ncbi:hypothetical protein U9M48_035694 [Paspalum notatum var. saurae]|uniref:Uncharacterized protein n=1 Tax=Paspalum notatum var. saurae TaxID=547442 RepID=A0AAQ3UBN3_PASNO